MTLPNGDHYTFTSDLLFDPDAADGYMKHYVPIPQAVSAALRTAGITHVEGHLNAIPFRRALHTRPDGTLCLKFGKGWLDKAELHPFMPVIIDFAPDHDPNHVDIPDELAAAFQDDPEAEHLWMRLSPGRRRTLVYPIESAKRPETRIKRAKALIHELRSM
ncbi:MAG: YdeI/OmpD-associated family protein [bacterium]|nr:YdeI/OmpD-associated family protein [bacterium]